MTNFIENRYLSTNPLVNKEDVKDHFGVGAVFHENQNILVMEHKKYNFLKSSFKSNITCCGERKAAAG